MKFPQGLSLHLDWHCRINKTHLIHSYRLRIPKLVQCVTAIWLEATTHRAVVLVQQNDDEVAGQLHSLIKRNKKEWAS